MGGLYIALIIVDIVLSPIFNLTVTISKSLAIGNDRFLILVKLRIFYIDRVRTYHHPSYYYLLMYVQSYNLLIHKYMYVYLYIYDLLDLVA